MILHGGIVRKKNRKISSQIEHTIISNVEILFGYLIDID